jgi:hypothetical protein
MGALLATAHAPPLLNAQLPVSMPGGYVLRGSACVGPSRPRDPRDAVGPCSEERSFLIL